MIGCGAHQDPAGEMAASINAARQTAAGLGGELAVVTFVCGTRSGPAEFGRPREYPAPGRGHCRGEQCPSRQIDQRYPVGDWRTVDERPGLAILECH